MIQRIDHLVVIAPNLDDMVAGATEAGFTVAPGGTHADGFTHNALIAFKDGSYIELIAPVDGIEGKNHRWFPRLAKGGGLVDMCLGSDDLAADVARMQAAGKDYSEPLANGRFRPDGVKLRWKGAMPPGVVGERGWPFLIEDVTPRPLRVSDDAAQTTHANGSLGVAGVTVVTNDLALATADYEAITGREARNMASAMDESSLANFIHFDDSWIMLTHPTAGEASRHLEIFGAGPYNVAIRTHEGPISPGTGRRIDPKLMSGAAFDLV